MRIMEALSLLRSAWLVLAIVITCAQSAVARQVQFGGITFLGDNEDIPKNYRWSSELLAATDGTGHSILEAALRDRLSAVQNPGFSLEFGESLGSLRLGTGSNIATAFALDRETVSKEKIGDVWKLMVTLSAQAIFVEFTKQDHQAYATLLASWPSVVRYTDTKSHEPTDDDVRSIVRGLYLGNLGVNIFDDFAQSLSTLRLNTEVGNRVQVKAVAIGEGAVPHLPPQFAEDRANLEAAIAQEFNKALSVNQRIPVLPYVAGYAAAVQGNMALRFADGSLINVKIPEADYEIYLTLKELKRLEYSKTAAGTGLIYGSYLTVRALEPLSNKIYFDATLKNGATKLVPASQANVEDWPAFQESLLILIQQFTQALDAPTAAWAVKYAGNKALVADLKKLQETLQSCR